MLLGCFFFLFFYLFFPFFIFFLFQLALIAMLKLVASKLCNQGFMFLILFMHCLTTSKVVLGDFLVPSLSFS